MPVGHRERHEAYRQRNIAKYLSEHGGLPSCECGCGNPVRFNANGKPCRFIIHHQPKHGLELGRQRAGKELIPLDDFRRAMFKLKAHTNETWKQIAERGGISHTHLNSLMYGNSGKRNVGKEWTTHFMRRLAGLPAPASRFQKRQQTKGNAAIGQIEGRAS